MDKLKRRTFPFGVYLLTGVMLAACGGGGGGGDSPGESRASSVQGAGDKELSSGGGEAQPGDDAPNTIGGGSETGGSEPDLDGDVAEPGYDPPIVVGGDAEPGDDSSNIIGGGAEPVDDEPDTSGDVAESGDDEPDPSGDVAESGDDEPDPDEGAGENLAPSISGTPATSIIQNSAYQFVPSASDPDGDPLTFNITFNTIKPDWTSFDPVTGALTGTPTEADVGTTDGIVISVTDGTSTVSLPPFGITVDAIGPASVTLTWTIPTTNEDGTALTDLAGFKIYHRTSTGTYSDSEPTIVDNPGVSSFVIENLSAGSAYFFAAKAFDTSGNDSEFSNEVEAP